MVEKQYHSVNFRGTIKSIGIFLKEKITGIFAEKRQTALNQIQKLLCYSGLEVQDYRDCQPEIEEENRRKMHVYLNMACGLLFAITCLSGGIGVLREHSLLIASPLWCARACVLWI